MCCKEQYAINEITVITDVLNIYVEIPFFLFLLLLLYSTRSDLPVAQEISAVIIKTRNINIHAKDM